MPSQLQHFQQRREVPTKSTMKLSSKALKGNAIGLNMAGKCDRFGKASTEGHIDSHQKHFAYRDETDLTGYAVEATQNAHMEEGTILDGQFTKLPRKFRMRDESGTLAPYETRVKRSRVKRVRVVSPSVTVLQVSDTITLSIGCLRIGTHQRMITTPVNFTMEYIEIASEGVLLKVSELESCEWSTATKLPALFLWTTPAACLRLRVQLGMSKNGETWYDSQNANPTERYFVMIFQNAPTFIECMRLENIFADMNRRNNFGKFPALLSYEEASDRLMSRNCTQLHQNPEPITTSAISTTSFCSALSITDSDQDELSEPQAPFAQLVRRLLVYPPPPGKGGITITTEDLRCLDQGEFLNDVIIDFYLKFLHGERLKREDANRCHMFSSFFYKCLTQKHQKKASDGALISSIQEGRHRRVKTWTKHVDLFQKDFIFIPINHSAHWFLAVICYPGLVASHYKANTRGHILPASPVDLTRDECMHTVWEGMEDNLSCLNPMSLFYSQTESEQLSESSAPLNNNNDEMSVCCMPNNKQPVQVVKDVLDCEEGACTSIHQKRPCILLMDSLPYHNGSSVVRTLREYLEVEWQVKMGTLQNFGKHVMAGWSPLVPKQDNSSDCGIYLLQYVESFLKKPPQNLDSKMDLSNWFPQGVVKSKRNKIKELILKMHKQQNADLRE